MAGAPRNGRRKKGVPTGVEVQHFKARYYTPLQTYW